MYSHIIKILKAIKLGTLEVSTYNLFFLFIFHLFFSVISLDFLM